MTSGGFASPNSLLGFFRNTGSTNITDLTISYDAERYRRNSAAASVQFYYSLNGTSWTAVTAGDIAAASFPTGTSVYGFNPPNLVVNVSSFTITSLSIAPTGDFYLRWNVNTTGGNSQGIGIDNVSLTATFAPAGTNTSVQFASTGSTVNENVGTVNLTLEITDEDATNDTEVDVVLITGAPGRVNSYTTQTVTFPGGSGADETVTITVTDNSLCDGNTVIGFELQNITGGQGTAFIGTNDTYDLSITDNDVCTGVSFDVTSATVSEGVGTYNVQVNITDFSPSVATSVDVALSSGNAARINGYTTQTVTFPANSGTAQNVTITVTDNGSCDGTAVLNFGLENLTGGQGTPFVGPNSTRSLTVSDNDQTTDNIISDSFETDGAGTRYTLSQGHFSGPSSGDFFLRGIGTAFTGAGGLSITSPNGTNYIGGEDMDGGGGAAERILTFNAIDANGYSNLAVSLLVGSNAAANFDNNANADYLLVERRIDGGSWVTVGAFRSKASVGAANGRLALDADLNGVGDASPEIGTTFANFNFNVGAVGDELEIRVRFRSDADGEDIYFDNVVLTGDRCSTTYYSRADGNVGDAIWSDSPSGTAGSVTFDRFKSMVVQNGDVVNLNANTRINDFTVNTGGQLDIAATNTLTVSGDLFDNDGTITAADNSTIVLNSPALTTVESASTLDLFNLTANTPGDLLTDATISIRGTLLLQDGDFDASLGAVTLVSNASGTGRLGPVAATASYTGDMTVQRYIPAGATNWRFLTSPVDGQTVNEWKDDFITAGFPGADAPGFSNPPGSGVRWPSVRWYNETRSIAVVDSGWVGVSSVSQTLDEAQGFAAWCGTGLNTTTAFTIDVTGAPRIASSPITTNLSYTANNSVAIDGWNALGNPFPSPIRFSALTRTGPMEDYVWVFNPASGNMAVWDISDNVGTNGGNDTIQSSQAFMVKATSTGASVTFEEADKVNDRVGGLFGGSQQSLFNGVRLKISSGINSFSDEALVILDRGEVGVDASDIAKMTFAHPDAPQIATVVGTDLFAINATGEYDTALEIPVMVNAGVSGNYTITASNMENIGLTCLVLEDLLTGTITPLVEGASYTFAVDAAASTSEPRLMLHASVPVPVYADATSCNATTDGRGTVVHVGTSPMDITWTNATGEVLLQQTIAEGVAIFSDLAPGDYGVTVSSEAGCGALSTTFTIEAPAALEVEATLAMASCPATADGLVDLLVLGGTAPYTYLWSDGSTEEDLTAAAGTYTVTITDDRGCTVFTPEFTIAAGEAPVALAEVSSTTTLVNTPVSFTNTSTEGDSYLWEFGDGQFSTEFAPEHTWTVPGTYTVTLTVDNGSCTSTWTAQVVVETSTSISGTTATDAVNVWFANDKFVVEHGISNGLPVVIEVLDATGRLHSTRQVAGTPARVNIAADGFSTGIWFVRIQNNGAVRTVRVPVVR